MATTYRYLLADLRTNAILAELPLTGVNFTQALNTAGTFSGHLLLSDPLISNYDIAGSTIPARTAIYVDRDGVLVWGGILWTRSYSSQNQTLTIQAREFESYFERRRITQYADFFGIDQLTIAQSIVNTAQSVTGGDIGITVGTETSGVLTTRTFYGYEFKDVYSAIKDLSNSNSGFDFNIDVAYDSYGTPQKYLHLDYPYRGKVYDATDPSSLVFEFPSNLVMYEYPEDGLGEANTVYVIGPGSNEGKVLANYADTSTIAAGYPLLEDTATYNDIYDTTLLANLAKAEVAAKLNPVTFPKVVIPAYIDPILGSYKTGDQALIRITDERFPAPNGGFGASLIKRITAINVQPGETGPENVTLTFADIPYRIT